MLVTSASRRFVRMPTTSMRSPEASHKGPRFATAG
jgi:hypothetical protein